MSVAIALSSVAGDPANGLDATRTSLIVFGTLTLSANYGGAATHGDTVDFTKLGISTDFTPKFVSINEQVAAGSAGSGYLYNFNYGTTLANGVLNIKGSTNAAGQGGTEITEGGAYSGFTPSLAGVVLNFMAICVKQV